jgi:hypothetical protein
MLPTYDMLKKIAILFRPKILVAKQGTGNGLLTWKQPSNEPGALPRT